jgi:hypothetical protein
MIRVTTTANTFEFLQSKIQIAMRGYTSENTQVARMDAYWSCYPCCHSSMFIKQIKEDEEEPYLAGNMMREKVTTIVRHSWLGRSTSRAQGCGSHHRHAWGRGDLILQLLQRLDIACSYPQPYEKKSFI